MEIQNKYLLGVFNECDGLKFFYYDKDLAFNSKVIIETSYGNSIGLVKSSRAFLDTDIPAESKLEDLFSPIIALADEKSNEIFLSYEEKALLAKKKIQKQADLLGLVMNLNRVFISIDGSYLLATYTADEKVDFRELLKVLKNIFTSKIELRQIGARDKAKLIGGVGICGLPICCSSFLKSFEGISINLAKNQMLMLNTSKLVGQCNKFMCCLKYEDDLYTDLKVNFPAVNETLIRDKITYKVKTINVLSDFIVLESEEGDVLEITSEEFHKMSSGHAYKSTQRPSHKNIASKKETKVLPQQEKIVLPEITEIPTSTDNKVEKSNKQPKPNTHQIKRQDKSSNRNYFNRKKEDTNNNSVSTSEKPARRGFLGNIKTDDGKFDTSKLGAKNEK